MKLGETIRKYRKACKLTQEQVADALSVTAPAVNKWENGVSYPDITLLAPLARLLGVDTNTLLCFHEEITDREIDRYVHALTEQIHADGYAAAFDTAMEWVRTYPTCDKLILFLSQMLNAYLSVQPMEDTERYEKQITAWLELVYRSETRELSDLAANSLCAIYISREDYARAQRMLDGIPPVGYDKRTMQAVVLNKQGKTDEAYRIYEEMVFQHAAQLCSALQLLSSLAHAHDNASAGAQYIDLAARANEIFALNPLSGCMIELSGAMQARNTTRCLELLRQFADNPSTSDARRSQLYPHMTFKPTDLTEIRRMMNHALETDEALAFLRGEPEFQHILRRLDDSTR